MPTWCDTCHWRHTSPDPKEAAIAGDITETEYQQRQAA